MRIEDGKFYIGERIVPWAKEVFVVDHEIKELDETIRRRGVHLMFEAGYTLSIQWGTSNYCQNRTAFNPEASWHEDCPDAEIALWDREGDWHDWGDNQVKGWVDEDTILGIIDLLAKGEWNFLKYE